MDTSCQGGPFGFIHLGSGIEDQQIARAALEVPRLPRSRQRRQGQPISDCPTGQGSQVTAVPCDGSARVEVPASPDMTVERFTVIAAPPDVIYRVLVAVSDWPTWDPSVTVARPKAPRPLTAGDSFFKQESGFAIEARVLEAEPGRLLRWRGSPPGGGVVGVHSYRLVPIGGGRTLVVDREEFSRWYLRLFGWATDLHIGRQYQATLEALRTTVESSLGAVSSEH